MFARRERSERRCHGPRISKGHIRSPWIPLQGEDWTKLMIIIKVIIYFLLNMCHLPDIVHGYDYEIKDYSRTGKAFKRNKYWIHLFWGLLSLSCLYFILISTSKNIVSNLTEFGAYRPLFLLSPKKKMKQNKTYLAIHGLKSCFNFLPLVIGTIGHNIYNCLLVCTWKNHTRLSKDEVCVGCSLRTFFRLQGSWC